MVGATGFAGTGSFVSHAFLSLRLSYFARTDRRLPVLYSGRRENARIASLKVRKFVNGRLTNPTDTRSPSRRSRRDDSAVAW